MDLRVHIHLIDVKDASCLFFLVYASSMPLERPIRGGTRVRVDRGEATILGALQFPPFARPCCAQWCFPLHAPGEHRLVLMLR